MPGKRRVCIIGGGATGVALLWALSQDKKARQEWDVTLIHNQPKLGGHSLTYPVPHNGKTFNVDIGVQFIAPMLYPNVHEMLKHPDFKSRVPVFNYPELKIACAFPRDEHNRPVNWGNFPAYQQGEKFALYTQEMEADSGTFQNFIGRSILRSGNETLSDYFNSQPAGFKDSKKWVNYFLKPYLSIINGYGAALMHETIFGDLFPLFTKFPLPRSWGLPTPLGSFTNPGVGWQRFTNGARSWVQAMADVAQTLAPAAIHTSSCAQAVWTDPKTRQVTVQWVGGEGNLQEEVFDKVVLTTDMWTNSILLNNADNQHLWKKLYKEYIGYGLNYEDSVSGPHPAADKLCSYPDPKYGSKPVWDLMWGMCYIHTDSCMLSPDLMDQEETLQFNAYYAPGTKDGNYNLSKTFTTYIQKNVLSDPDADGLYLTMYGYIPDPATDKVPDPTKVCFQEPWTHGKWTPAFMSGPKGQLHLAQGLGTVSYPGQSDTNVYFAGNNTVADSEEGALDSAMAMAEYAFNVKYPLASFNPIAWFIYLTYRNVMFPGFTAARILKFLRAVFFVEVALDSYAALLGAFSPAAYVAQYTPQIVTGMPLELIRWFGVNLIPLLLVELVALLKKRDDLLAWVLGIYLIGDIAQFFAYLYAISTNPTAPLTGGFLFSIATVVFLAFVRIIWLLFYRSFSKKTTGGSS
jgi:hypothetical protein